MTIILTSTFSMAYRLQELLLLLQRLSLNQISKRFTRQFNAHIEGTKLEFDVYCDLLGDLITSLQPAIT